MAPNRPSLYAVILLMFSSLKICFGIELNKLNVVVGYVTCENGKPLANVQVSCCTIQDNPIVVGKNSDTNTISQKHSCTDATTNVRGQFSMGISGLDHMSIYRILTISNSERFSMCSVVKLQKKSKSSMFHLGTFALLNSSLVSSNNIDNTAGKVTTTQYTANQPECACNSWAANSLHEDVYNLTLIENACLKSGTEDTKFNYVHGVLAALAITCACHNVIQWGSNNRHRRRRKEMNLMQADVQHTYADGHARVQRHRYSREDQRQVEGGMSKETQFVLSAFDKEPELMSVIFSPISDERSL